MNLSRRTFIGLTSAAIAAPLGFVVIRGCLRKKPVDTDDGVTPEPTDMDDVGEAATFRPPLPKTEPTIRVCVLRVRQPDSVVVIGAKEQWLSFRREQAVGKGVALAGPLAVRMEPAGWSITDSKGFLASVDGMESIAISALDDPAAILPVQEGGELNNDRNASSSRSSGSADGSKQRAYVGELRLVARPDLHKTAPQAFDLINHVPLESYLPGVLAGELFSHWQLETFAAQAVAARSFAATEAAVFAGRRHYDVTNTTNSQMFIGNVTQAKPLQAVAMTRGLMLAHDGLLVSGYYSSCCGGAAAAATDIMRSNPVNNAVPLRGRSGSDICTEAPVYHWTVRQPIDLLTRRIVAYGKQRGLRELTKLSRLVAIEPTTLNPNGRPLRFRLVDDREFAVEISAEHLRRAVNHSGPGVPAPDKPLRSSFVRAIFSREFVTFDGYGFGHGVGLCQYGAEALAKAGHSHREILQWYYPGVELVQAYA